MLLGKEQPWNSSRHQGEVVALVGTPDQVLTVLKGLFGDGCLQQRAGVREGEEPKQRFVRQEEGKGFPLEAQESQSFCAGRCVNDVSNAQAQAELARGQGGQVERPGETAMGNCLFFDLATPRSQEGKKAIQLHHGEGGGAQGSDEHIGKFYELPMLRGQPALQGGMPTQRRVLHLLWQGWTHQAAMHKIHAEAGEATSWRSAGQRLESAGVGPEQLEGSRLESAGVGPEQLGRQLGPLAAQDALDHTKPIQGQREIVEQEPVSGEEDSTAPSISTANHPSGEPAKGKCRPEGQEPVWGEKGAAQDAGQGADPLSISSDVSTIYPGDSGDSHSSWIEWALESEGEVCPPRQQREIPQKRKGKAAKKAKRKEEKGQLLIPSEVKRLGERTSSRDVASGIPTNGCGQLGKADATDPKVASTPRGICQGKCGLLSRPPEDLPGSAVPTLKTAWVPGHLPRPPEGQPGFADSHATPSITSYLANAGVHSISQLDGVLTRVATLAANDSEAKAFALMASVIKQQSLLK